MFNFTKKGQAAMDLLLTYGWVLVVIIGIIAVLASTDIFNFGDRVSPTCGITSSSLNCDAGFEIESGSSGSVALKLTNKQPNVDVILTGLSINTEGVSAVSCNHVVDGLEASASSGEGNLTLSGGETNGVKFTGCALTDGTHVFTDEKKVYDVVVSYNDGGFIATAEGKLRGKQAS